jgi:hypothetical protein
MQVDDNNGVLIVVYRVLSVVLLVTSKQVQLLPPWVYYVRMDSIDKCSSGCIVSVSDHVLSCSAVLTCTGKFYCPRMASMNKPAYAAIQVCMVSTV